MDRPAKFAETYAALVARAWSDEAFKERLLKQPQRVLEEAGLQLPAGVEIEVVEDTGTHIHLVLPPQPPREKELSDRELSGVAGGMGGSDTDYVSCTCYYYVGC